MSKIEYEKAWEELPSDTSVSLSGSGGSSHGSQSGFQSGLTAEISKSIDPKQKIGASISGHVTKNSGEPLEKKIDSIKIGYERSVGKDASVAIDVSGTPEKVDGAGFKFKKRF